MFRKRSVQFGVLLLLIAACVWGAPRVFAQQDALTEKQVKAIQQNCLNAQVGLQLLQYSDAAARINRGSAYESIVLKMIAPFNGRAATNRLEKSSELVVATNELDRTFASFKQHYTAYEEALSKTLEIKCQDQPVTFYDQLNATRAARALLAADVAQLGAEFKKYQALVEQISQTIQTTEGVQ